MGYLTATNIRKLLGLTATASELNIMDGVTATAAELSTVVIQTTLTDISTAGSAWVASPFAGTISKIQTIINGAISGADAGITTEINGTAVTGGAITIANASSAAGDVDTTTPSAANTVAVGDKIEIITDGASTGTVSAVVNIHITL